MLTPIVTYLGPAHPQHEATLPIGPPSQHTGPELEVGGSEAPRQQSRRTVVNLKLVSLLTTIAMLALPTANALGASRGHF
jgi:hypothetical protein